MRQPEEITMSCACAEGILTLPNGTQTRLPGWHDCAYIAARNALIPEALALANPGDKDGRSARFMAAMTQLAKERIHDRPSA